MPVSVIWEHVRENTFLSKLCIGSKLFYTEKNWPSSFFNNVNLRLTVFSFTSAKLVLQQSHYAKLKKYWIIYLESYVFANSLSRNIFREIAKKKGIEKFKVSVNYGWDKNTIWNLLKPHHEGGLQRTNIILFFNPILIRGFIRYE